MRKAWERKKERVAFPVGTGSEHLPRFFCRSVLLRWCIVIFAVMLRTRDIHGRRPSVLRTNYCGAGERKTRAPLKAFSSGACIIIIRPRNSFLYCARGFCWAAVFKSRTRQRPLRDRRREKAARGPDLFIRVAAARRPVHNALEIPRGHDTVRHRIRWPASEASSVKKAQWNTSTPLKTFLWGSGGDVLTVLYLNWTLYFICRESLYFHAQAEQTERSKKMSKHVSTFYCDCYVI